MFQILGNYRKQKDKTQRVSTLIVASLFRFQPCRVLAVTICRKIAQSSEIQFAHPAKGVKTESESKNHSVETPWAIQSMEFSRPEYWNG